MTKAELWDEAARLRKAGLTLREIGQRLGRSHTRVARILKDMKVTKPPKKRQRNYLRVQAIRCAVGHSALIEVDALHRGKPLTCTALYTYREPTRALLWDGDEIIGKAEHEYQVDALDIFHELVGQLPKEIL